MLSVATRGAQQTLEFGSRLGSAAGEGLIVSLSGVLGVGKTWLAKGIASTYVGIDADEITSPAFNLAHEYVGPAGRRVIHIDFYRLDSLNATDTQLFDEYLADESALILVEWGDRFLPSLADSYVQIDITGDADDDTLRLVSISAVGDDSRVRSFLQQLEAA